MIKTKIFDGGSIEGGEFHLILDESAKNPQVVNDTAATLLSTKDAAFSLGRSDSMTDNLDDNNKIDTVKSIADPFTTWLIDLDGFDYSLFKIDWLNRCYAPLLKSISYNSKARVGISKKLAEEYLQGRVDKRIMKRYLNIKR